MATLFHSARKLDAQGQVDDFWMLVEGDTITSTGNGHAHPEAARKVDVGGHWLVPGFIDLHGHGGGGYAYDDGPDALTAALDTHRQHGTTRSVISLVANPIDDLLATLDMIAEFAARDPLVLGSHLEGPFLAPENRGAHSPEYLLEPSPATVDLLLNAARGTLRQITSPRSSPTRSRRWTSSWRPA